MLRLWIWGLSWAVLCGTLIAWWALGASEEWWLSALVLYGPRFPLLIVVGVLTVAAAVYCRRAVLVNLATCVTLLACVTGWRWSAGTFDPPWPTGAVSIASCNVQGFRPQFAEVLTDIALRDPTIVAFQEAFYDHPLRAEFFRGWHEVRVEEYLLASRHPVRSLASCRSTAFDRTSAVVFEVDLPQGPIRVFNVHPTSARPGVVSLFRRDEGLERFADHVAARELEAGELRGFVEQWRGAGPWVVAGDLNAPTESPLYRQVWGEIQNTFDVAGRGFGFTAPCQPSRYWPSGIPWVRVDHVLASAEWRVDAAWVGSRDGSDHRAVGAVLWLPPEMKWTTEAPPAGLAVEPAAGPPSNPQCTCEPSQSSGPLIPRPDPWLPSGLGNLPVRVGAPIVPTNARHRVREPHPMEDFPRGPIPVAPSVIDTTGESGQMPVPIGARSTPPS